MPRTFFAGMLADAGPSQLVCLPTLVRIPMADQQVSGIHIKQGIRPATTVERLVTQHVIRQSQGEGINARAYRVGSVRLCVLGTYVWFVGRLLCPVVPGRHVRKGLARTDAHTE